MSSRLINAAHTGDIKAIREELDEGVEVNAGDRVSYKKL